MFEVSPTDLFCACKPHFRYCRERTREPLILGFRLGRTAAGAYALHGLITDTGPAGWINYFQQSIFGSYSMKVTVLVLTFGVLAVATWRGGWPRSAAPTSLPRYLSPRGRPASPGARPRQAAGILSLRFLQASR
jgi:hypothetical protein